MTLDFFQPHWWSCPVARGEATQLPCPSSQLPSRPPVPYGFFPPRAEDEATAGTLVVGARVTSVHEHNFVVSVALPQKGGEE